MYQFRLNNSKVSVRFWFICAIKRVKNKQRCDNVPIEDDKRCIDYRSDKGVRSVDIRQYLIT
jgi:hypothetical protein